MDPGSPSPEKKPAPEPERQTRPQPEKRGPDPEVLRIEGDWEEAVRKALQAGRPHTDRESER